MRISDRKTSIIVYLDEKDLQPYRLRFPHVPLCACVYRFTKKDGAVVESPQWGMYPDGDEAERAMRRDAWAHAQDMMR